MGGAQVIPFRKLCGYVLLYDTKSGKGEGIQRGVENSMLWSEIGSGFEFKLVAHPYQEFRGVPAFQRIEGIFCENSFYVKKQVHVKKLYLSIP